MRDEDKTKEQLILELAELRTRMQGIESAWTEFEGSVEKLISFEKTIETMQVGVTISDLEGNILYTNPAELEIHGYEAGELTGRSVRMLAPRESWNPMSLDEIIAIKRWKRESENMRKDGTVFPVQLMSDVIRDEEGAPMCIVTICEDISERRRMEDEIRERVEELEVFYEAAVSREVKMKTLKQEIEKLKRELAQYARD